MSSPGMDHGREETADAEASQTRKEVVNGTRQVLKAFKEFSTKLDARRQARLARAVRAPVHQSLLMSASRCAAVPFTRPSYPPARCLYSTRSLTPCLAHARSLDACLLPVPARRVPR